MTKILGLTGGIATGKTLVTDFFLAKGIPVVDGDKIARRVVEPHTPTLAKIVAAFGPDVLMETGKLNRSTLAKIVFADEKKLAHLNQLMSSALVTAFEEAITEARQKNVPLLVLDIPLLFEQHYEKYCDEVMVVVVSEKTQLARLMARNGFDEATAQNRIAAQMPLAEKSARADVVIDNNGSVAKTLSQVAAWLKMQNLDRPIE